MKGTCPVMSPLFTPCICPLRIMFMTSYPCLPSHRIFATQPSQQTLVCLVGQFDKRFSQRSSTILALAHDALTERQELPFVDYLEKTSVGKLDKKVLRQKHG